MIKTKIKNWTKKILIAALAAFAISLFVPTFAAIIDTPDTVNQFVAFADEAPPAGDPAGDTGGDTGGDNAVDAVADKEQQKRIITAVVSFQDFINRLIWPILMFTGILMDNSILFGNGMEEQLRGIWVPIRNLTNIIFVLILVGIALYNVLGLGEESGNYSLKAILPRIVIGLIAVNFSFLGIKVFLDGVSVLTTSVFALPDQVSEGLATVIDDDNEEDKETVKRFCLMLQGQKINSETISKDKEQELKDKAVVLIAKQAARSVGYVSSFPKDAKVVADANGAVTQDDILGKVKSSVEGDKAAAIESQYIENRDKFLKGQICSGFGLTTEGKKLFKNYTARSAPMAFVLNMSNIVFYSELDESIEKFEQITTNVLFSLLLYIIYLASFAALFIVLLARLVVLWLAIVISPLLVLGYTVPVFKEKVSAFDTVNDQFVKNAIAPLIIGLAMTIGWIMLKSIQNVNFSSQSVFAQLSQGAQIPVNGLSTVQDLMVMFGTVAVVWLGVFAAADETVAGAVTGTMKSGLQRAAGWAVKTPLYHASVIPIKLPGDDKAQPYTLGQVGRVFTNLGGAPEGINDLSERIAGKEVGSTVTPEKILASKNPDEFVEHARKLDRTRLGNENIQNNMARWLERDGNLTKLKNWATGNPERQKLVKLLKEFQAADKSKRKQMVDKLDRAFKALPAGTTPPGAPANPNPTANPAARPTATPTAAAPGAITANEKIGTVNLSASKTNIDKVIADHGGKAVTNAGEKDTVVNKLKGLDLKNDDGTKAAFSIEVVNRILGEETAAQLIKQYDPTDAAKGTTALLEDLNKDETATP